jgi:hypothetical protein
MTNAHLVAGKQQTQLINSKVLPLDEESNVNDQMEAYCLLDDINAGVLEAYIAGYVAAFTGEKK